MKNEGIGLKAIAKRIKGRVEGPLTDEPIRHLILDSRKFQGRPNALFFALKGESHDGHFFLDELYQKGQRRFVVERMPEIPQPDATYVLVEDALRALQQLAGSHRKQFNYPVLAITGSNGKTVLKEWAHQLIGPDRRMVRSPKSYNSQVGVPLSLWAMREDHELAVIEAGISRPGEMERLERMIRPTIGIMSNIGSAHQEHFAKIGDKVKSKMALFRRAECLIYCADHPLIHKRAQKSGVERLIDWSAKGHPAEVQLIDQKIRKGCTHLKVRSDGTEVVFRIPFTDQASVENAMHLFCLCREWGLSKQKIQRRMSALQAVDMRLELKAAREDALLVNDSYNSDPESLRIALDFMGTHKKRRSSVLLLSDMVDQKEEDWVERVIALVEEKKVDLFIGVGPVLQRNADRFPDPSLFFSNTADLLGRWSEIHWSSKIILLKGARRFAFEQIRNRLEYKLHQTVLRIDLNALSENLQKLRMALRPEVRIMAVVKAFSYGAGSVEVASLLQFNKVDHLAVAYADEGLALRCSGVRLPIMVMNPDADSFPAMIENELEPEIYSFSVLQQFIDALKQTNYSGERRPVHIKLDTGMHRLGFVEEDVHALCSILQNESQLHLASVFSHLAASEDPSLRRETLIQIERFRAMSAQLSEAVPYPVCRHILNSAGIRNYPEAQFDMVRTGIGLHGSGEQSGRPVATLLTRISQIKMLRKGDGVGYGFSFTAPKDMRIATLSIGYADGFDRRLSNGVGQVFLNGHRAEVVGKVCMDLCMVDVTHIPCQEGDEVEVFGTNIRVEELAERMDTIPYEVLTSISQRVKRIYVQE